MGGGTEGSNCLALVLTPPDNDFHWDVDDDNDDDDDNNDDNDDDDDDGDNDYDDYLQGTWLCCTTGG